MDTVLVSVGLPATLAVVMFGLGLTLTADDFRRTARQPRAVGVALAVQVVLLPAICLGLIAAVRLDPLLAVGMMLLAASPGSTTANLFSHLFRGDVALNITLTAINSVLAVLTVPLVVNLAVAVFDPPTAAGSIGLEFGKAVQVFAVVLIPVVIGMAVRRAAPRFAERAERPVRVLSALVLAIVIVGAIAADIDSLGTYLADIGLVATLFCACSLTIGYLLPRLLRIGPRQAIASTFEVGIHNGTLAITVALGVLGNERLAIPAAIYGVVCMPLALLAGFLLSRTVPADTPEPASRPPR